jgi:hypothetical protein
VKRPLPQPERARRVAHARTPGGHKPPLCQEAGALAEEPLPPLAEPSSGALPARPEQSAHSPAERHRWAGFDKPKSMLTKDKASRLQTPASNPSPQGANVRPTLDTG